MPMQASVAVGDQGASLMQPRFSGLSHVSLACRDLAESKRFYSEVLGGELVHEIPGFVEYRIADVIFFPSKTRVGPLRITSIRTMLFISMGQISIA